MKDRKSRKTTVHSRMEYEVTTPVSLFPLQVATEVLPQAQIPVLFNELLNTDISQRNNCTLFGDKNGIRFRNYFDLRKKTIRKDILLTAIQGFYEVVTATLGIVSSNQTVKEYQMLGFHSLNDYRAFVNYLLNHDIQPLFGKEPIEYDRFSVSSENSMFERPMYVHKTIASVPDVPLLTLPNVDYRKYERSYEQTEFRNVISLDILQDMLYADRLDGVGKLELNKRSMMYTLNGDNEVSWDMPLNFIHATQTARNDLNHMVVQVVDRQQRPYEEILFRIGNPNDRNEIMELYERERRNYNRGFTQNRRDLRSTAATLVAVNRFRQPVHWLVDLFTKSSVKQHSEDAARDFVHWQTKTQQPTQCKAMVKPDRIAFGNVAGVKVSEPDVDLRQIKDELLLDDCVLLVVDEDVNDLYYQLLRFRSKNEAEAFYSQRRSRARTPSAAQPRSMSSLALRGDYDDDSDIVVPRRPYSAQKTMVYAYYRHYPMTSLSGNLPQKLLLDVENKSSTLDGYGSLQALPDQLQYSVNANGSLMPCWVTSYELLHRAYVASDDYRHIVVARKTPDSRPDHYTLFRFRDQEDGRTVFDVINAANCEIHRLEKARANNFRSYSSMSNHSDMDQDQTPQQANYRRNFVVPEPKRPVVQMESYDDSTPVPNRRNMVEVCHVNQPISPREKKITEDLALKFSQNSQGLDKKQLAFVTDPEQDSGNGVYMYWAKRDNFRY